MLQTLANQLLLVQRATWISMKVLLSYRILIPLALILGLAPFYPQPHLVEKIGMLIAGTLQKPIDLFDLFWHAWPFALLAFQIVCDIRGRTTAKG